MGGNSQASVWALVASLRHDPFYVAITEHCGDNEDRRREMLFQYFDYSMSEGARLGRCVIAQDSAAAAVWLLPVSPEQTVAAGRAKAEFLASALGPIGAANYHRIIEFMAPRAQSVVSGPAWYLSIIGVSPTAQGRGVGARLVQTTLAEADDAGAACFLETFSPRSLRFYERLGFKVVASHQEPVTGEEYFIMERAPNNSLERTREP